MSRLILDRSTTGKRKIQKAMEPRLTAQESAARGAAPRLLRALRVEILS